MTVETCAFCGAQTTTEQAVEDGWAPSYWDLRTDAEIMEPVCPDCCQRELLFNEEHGDWERPIRV
jgi:hypothetical protein